MFAGLSRLSQWWGTHSVATRDREFAILLTVLSFAEPLSQVGPRFGDLPAHGSALVGGLLSLGMTLPLAVRTRWPAACLTAVAVSFAVHESLGCPPTFGGLGLYIALYSLGAHQARRRRIVGAAATGGFVVFGAVLHALGSPSGPTDFLIYYVVLVVMWGLGALVRGRRAQDAERRRLSAEAAVLAERSRLARELHDVVTHHVTAMVVQAGAAKYLTGTPDRLDESLDAIHGAGRRALSELRFLLGVLEAPGDTALRHPPRNPTRMPGRVSDLVEQTRAGGQPVELTEDGERPDMPLAAQLTAYRVVQESLTNAVKYAAGRQTLVRLTHTRDWTDIEVTTAGATADAQRSPALRDGGPHLSGGRGLTGLRDRVELLGGSFTAGPGPDGHYRVHARIPAGGPA
ncbi:sensor histidine kinase [Streptomyces sp. NBC_00102]|uniref:sensor histidine kinase n=1 Tax=Streptomyces sp. NBC_00102 TaxID=2975652 RepID=UPI00224F251C|nr:histidine kinase [Streptomyces sp. NBC_00102]MCX5400325.1 histidine kinase [Streptomyces sp. NBC_00102]